MKTAYIAIVSVVLGIVLTGLTGLINTTPNLVGASWYGWPTAWYTVPVVPNPVWNLNYANLVIDIVVWAIVVAIIMFIAMKLKK